MTTIQVIWCTAADHAEEVGKDPISTRTVRIEESGLDDIAICEKIYESTNLYRGEMWDLLKPLPEKRTHTSLSVGDYIVIDDRMYRCKSIGWERTDTFTPGLNFTNSEFGNVDSIEIW
jgi:hypothetical protein